MYLISLQDKGRLDGHMKDLKVKVLQVVKDYPDIQFKLGLIFNSTTPSPPPEGVVQSEGEQAQGEDHQSDQGGVGVAVEAEPEGVLLNENEMDVLVDELLGKFNNWSLSSESSMMEFPHDIYMLWFCVLFS